VKWVAKAAVQRVLSALPGGDRMNYVLQKHVTRQFPRSDEHFRLHGIATTHHFHSLRSHLPDVPAAGAHLYEYGAGWELIGPLVFWGLGVEHQTLVDIRPNLRFEQFNRTLLQYKRLREELENQASVQLRSVDPHPVDSVDELRIRFGIHYLAPRDARATDLEGNSFDLVSSTYTLEHIPRRDIVAILAESRRLLRPGGLVSSTIDMRDHFAFFDPAISTYNFLKFGDRAWALVNSPLQFQNRLRLPDHRGEKGQKANCLSKNAHQGCFPHFLSGSPNRKLIFVK